VSNSLLEGTRRKKYSQGKIKSSQNNYEEKGKKKSEERGTQRGMSKPKRTEKKGVITKCRSEKIYRARKKTVRD